MDLELVLRLISCIYFLGDEDLLTYDYDIGEYKMELFRKHALQSFFLSRAIRKYLPITTISRKHLATLKKQSSIKKGLLKELGVLGIYTDMSKGKD